MKSVYPVDPDTFLEFFNRLSDLPSEAQTIQAAMIMLAREFALPFEARHNMAYRFLQIWDVIRDPRLGAFIKPTGQDSEVIISSALLIACAVAEMPELAFDVPSLLKTAERFDAAGAQI